MAMTNHHDDFPERIKERLPLEDLIGETVPLSRQGRTLVGHHHLHDSQSGSSLHVSPDKQLWHCFNCDEGGDIFSWVMLHDRVTFPEALETLAHRAGIPLAEMTPEERQRQQVRRTDQELIARVFRAAAAYYASHLTAEWQDWCLDRWGLTPETLRWFRVGFAPVEAKGLWTHLRAQGFTSQELAKTGLFVRVGGQFLDFFQGRLVIPYWKTIPDDTHPGEATYFIGRKTEQTPDVEWEQGKYRKLPVHNPDDDKKAFITPVVTNHHFFGEHILSDVHGKTLLVTEGIADALAALQAGVPCLSPGTVRFRETDWPRLSRLCRHAAKVVIVNDVETSNAGEKGALNTARHLVLQGIDARIGVLPKPDDIDKIDIADFLKDHDRAVLVGLIESAPTLFDHYLARIHTVSEADQTAIAKDVYPLIAAVSGVEREKAERALAKALGVGLKALRASIADATSKASEASEERSPHGDEMPYVVNDGHIAVYEGINARLFPPKLVADFIATISHELTTEEGAKIFVVIGQTVTGRAFTVQMPAREFADERALKAALTEASGASSPIYAGMAKHLAPAIQLMSPKDVCRQRQYSRTGWAGDSFLMPGRVGRDVVIDLPRKLPYRVLAEANLTVGLKALQSLLTCMDQKQTTIGVTVPFQAPLAKLMGWQDERYALFIKGRTGSLKTSFAQMLMAIFGPDFLRDSLLIKFGQGATANAMMALATHAHDLPFLLDNYKPSTGGGARELINLIHNVLEGGEKDRLSRASTLRETKPVSCWPIITGEDVPDTDPASLARMLILPFSWQASVPNKALADAQEQAEHLCAVGHAWLTWLESDDGQIRAQEEATKFLDARADWAKTLYTQHKHMVNILRVATNLATHQLTWQVLCTHPSIGPVLHEFTNAHQEGLKALAEEMGSYTAEALEAHRFLSGLRELLLSQRLKLLPWPQTPGEKDQPERILGWEKDDGSVYLLPDTARQAVEQVLGRESFGYVTDRTIHSQLESQHALASKEAGRMTVNRKIGGKSTRLLHITSEAFWGDEPDLPKQE